MGHVYYICKYNYKFITIFELKYFRFISFSFSSLNFWYYDQFVLGKTTICRRGVSPVNERLNSCRGKGIWHVDVIRHVSQCFSYKVNVHTFTWMHGKRKLDCICCPDSVCVWVVHKSFDLNNQWSKKGAWKE